MELTFNKEGKRFYTEFKLTKDANLHLEFKKGTSINIYQNTIDGGKYDYVEGSSEYFGDVIDIDITALVYPKMIKVVSQIEPTYAAVVNDGEVTEIKSQSKEIEVTANGTTVVEPDAGFAYLNKVNVKTNVPTSGEGGGSASGSTWRYFDVSKVTNKASLQPIALLIKTDTFLLPYSALFLTKSDFVSIRDYITAIGVTPFVIKGPEMDEKIDMTAIDEVMNELGAKEITEEEFYNLNA